ncbi:hypothetical protein K443DRAFT_650001 [Laccaria amethystina LaAM-08-1]|uniref:Uncharacterized protein n=1 Tax=Laccaria amethystina LaAM-08-1 TaxID=1095629 RepID=A0A0C9XQL0_9AGAR|nr:hypothetical protein K443DRAFT_650001 [Laccaria amethystina LaAM-08-1]
MYTVYGGITKLADGGDGRGRGGVDRRSNLCCSTFVAFVSVYHHHQEPTRHSDERRQAHQGRKITNPRQRWNHLASMIDNQDVLTISATYPTSRLSYGLEPSPSTYLCSPRTTSRGMICRIPFARIAYGLEPDKVDVFARLCSSM